MAATDSTGSDDELPFTTRVARVIVSVVVLTLVSVVVGYGGWAILSVYVALGGTDPTTRDGDSLRERLVAWPERNREVMRTDGRVPVPWTP